MAEHRVPVTLKLDDSFTGRMAAAMASIDEMVARHTLADATWEPHDWDAF